MAHMTHKICVNQLFILLVRLPVNDRLPVVKILAESKVLCGFFTVRGWVGTPIPKLFKGQQYHPRGWVVLKTLTSSVSLSCILPCHVISSHHMPLPAAPLLLSTMSWSSLKLSLDAVAQSWTFQSSNKPLYKLPSLRYSATATLNWLRHRDSHLLLSRHLVTQFLVINQPVTYDIQLIPFLQEIPHSLHLLSRKGP